MPNKMKMRDKFSKNEREKRSREWEGGGKRKRKVVCHKSRAIAGTSAVQLFFIFLTQIDATRLVSNRLESPRLASMLVKRFAIFNFSLVYPFAIVNSESRFSARFLCGPNVQLPLAKISRRNGPTTLCNRRRQRESEREGE